MVIKSYTNNLTHTHDDEWSRAKNFFQIQNVIYEFAQLLPDRQVALTFWLHRLRIESSNGKSQYCIGLVLEGRGHLKIIVSRRKVVLILMALSQPVIILTHEIVLKIRQLIIRSDINHLIVRVIIITLKSPYHCTLCFRFHIRVLSLYTCWILSDVSTETEL